MNKILMIGAFLIFAGATHAQTIGGTINNQAGINGAGGLNSAGALNSAHPILDNGTTIFINTSGRNEGEFVPSTFASYKDVVAEAKADAGKHPLTLADVARQAQAQKKAAEPKSAMVLEQDSDGKLVIMNPKN